MTQPIQIYLNKLVTNFMSHVIDFLNNGTPWAITESALQTIHSIANGENNLEAVLKERGKPLDNTHKVITRGNVAVIPVQGALFPRANLFSEISGAYSVEMLARDLQAAQADSNVKAVVLQIDSPGGHTTMINEFAAQIKAFDKPIVSYVVGQAASAAYWIAAATDRIYLDSTAIIGSIGVVAAFSKKESGTTEFVSSNAPDKRPDLESDTGKAVIQSLVDDMESVFIESIIANRGMSREQITNLRGGVLVGAKAVSAGFADEISNLEAVIASLNMEFNMDLSTLKAEHSAVYKAAFDEGLQSLNATTLVSDSITAERTRIASILSCEESKGRELQAQTLALETDLNAEQAAKILASAPIGSNSKTPPAVHDGFVANMNKLKNPNVGVGSNQDTGELNTKDDNAKLAASILGFLPANNIRK
jgi:ClpP class serine protease